MCGESNKQSLGYTVSSAFYFH